MSLYQGKHIEKTFDEKQLRIIESHIDKERVAFIKDLLEFNGVEVVVVEDKQKNEEDPITFSVATTDLIFNAVIAVYERELHTKDGHIITPAYWNQKTTETHPQYYLEKK